MHEKCVRMSLVSAALVALLLLAGGEAWAVTTIIQVSLPTNDLVYDPFSDMIYASVPSTAGVPRGNSITPIDPYTGALGTSVFITSEPGKLALADDGSRLYAASNAANLVTPFMIPTQTAGTTFAIGGGDRRVADMEVAPGYPEILAVSRRVVGISPDGGGIAIYSNGTALPNRTSDIAINSRIEFGDDSTTLYGHANNISPLDFNSHTVDVSPTGGVGGPGFHAKYLLSGYGLDMEYDNGRMYFTNGQVLETTTPGPVGVLAASGPLEPDSSVDRTFFIHDNKLKAFSQTNFLLYGEKALPGISGSAGSLIRLDGDGVAFRTSNGQVFLVYSDIVPFNSMYDEADLDHDGDVDTADITKMLQNFTSNIGEAGGKMRVQGDVDGDGDVDTADVTTGLQRYTGSQPASPASVPEPSSIALFALGLATLAMFRRRR